MVEVNVVFQGELEPARGASMFLAEFTYFSQLL